ncbi:MAG: PDZ domain-containing protein [Chloroflexi bacterium]|nr:PDZ domain-containing protein [Chloroflexota bacterium]
MAQQMNLQSDQRGVLVEDVTPGGPAANAGLQGSTQAATLDGMQVNVGGDVIVAIDGQSVKDFGDMVTYLARNTKVGQVVNLTVLRQGTQVTVKVTLGARPATTNQAG